MKTELAGKLETILLVEDEDEIRTVTCDFLESKGYIVLAAENAERAIELFQESSARISMLITDVVMPGMNGVRLAEKLTREMPDLKVLYVSAYPRNVELKVCSSNFLQKPCSLHKLAEMVRTVLGPALETVTANERCMQASQCCQNS